MRPRFVIRLVGLFLFLFSVTLLPPALVAAYTGDGQFWTFIQSMLLLALPGVWMWVAARNQRGDLRNRETFLVVALFWILLAVLGALPLYLGTSLGLTDAVFESVSGFTTTGATALVGLDELPRSILFYRQQLQWYGGLGVIVLAIAVLPMLGVGGMQLYRAEIAGPMKEDKVTPRIAQTARFMLIIYLILTAACASAYWLAGMSTFDAIAHSFSTVATGGFSTHDAGIGHFDSAAIEAIAIAFMLFGAISFNLHFLVLYRRGPAAYWEDTQTRVFLLLVAVLIVGCAALLWTAGDRPAADALRAAAFQVVSVITTTGFTSEVFAFWPLGLPLLLIFTSFIGGCAGSTAGGIKVIRVLVLAKVGRRELQRLVHPQLVRPVRLGDRPLPDTVLDAIWGFFSVYVVTFAVLMLAIMATGVDQVTAFGVIAACLNNLGLGFGDATQFRDLGDTAKWICSAAMLLGRLEIFTVLVLFAPDFWRK